MNKPQALLVFLILIFASAAKAVPPGCLSPAGTQGSLLYSSPNMTFCDGWAWSLADVNTTATACSTAGQIAAGGTTLQFCNGSFLVNMLGSLTNGACTAGTSGTFRFNAASNWEEYCNGTNWIPIGKTTPTAGKVQNVSVNVVPSSGSFSSPAFASAVTTGNLIVCRCYLNDTMTITAMTDNKGNTYTRAIAPFTDNFSMTDELWYKENATGGAGLVVTGTLSANTGSTEIFECTEFSGIVRKNALDQTGTAFGTTDTAAGTTITTVSARELIYVASIEQAGCATGPGWTTVSTFGGDLVESKLVSSVGSYTTPTGSGCGTLWTEMVASFRLK